MVIIIKQYVLIKEYLNKSDISLHDKAILYYTLSESYRGINDKYNEMINIMKFP